MVLRDARIRAGLTQHDLAVLCGTTERTVRRYDGERRPYYRWNRIERRLWQEVDQLGQVDKSGLNRSN
ncbi:hypothetical protein CKY39_27280 [Variovorax boronicumulans]|uniref:HTH cro/C1-type domain-containing protein n=1 Tax=Variovorax boronicumulans TaxID=436515 RepID=A0A250DQF8_9BURK|nr:hypothetical protein CKY39_27280 [Variovorax boronicumulans]